MSATISWDAADYARNSTAQLRWARELIDKLLLGGDEALLDIGCGDGRVSADLSRRLSSGSVLGIDRSAQTVTLARRSFPVSEYSNLSFASADARWLAYEERFDVVFSSATLHWIRGHGTVLAGIERSLKVGGQFLLQMGGRGNAADLVAVLEGMMASLQWANHFTDFAFPYGFYGPQEYATWIAQAGLTAESIDLIAKDMAHQNAQALAGWVRTTWLPYTQ